MTELARRTSDYSYNSKADNFNEFAQWKALPKWLLLLASIGLVCAGTFDTIVAKLMNYQIIAPCPGCQPRNFEGPLWQTLISYIFEAAMIFVFLIDKYRAKQKGRTYYSEYVHLHQNKHSFVKPPCPVMYWAIPSFLDFLTSVGVNYAVVFIHASTLQLLRNFNIIATAILSLLWIRMALRNHQILGVLIVTFGLILVAIQEIIAPEKSTNYQSSIWLGIIFALIGTLANAVQVVYEERLFRKYHASPFEALGYFGIFGLIFSLISLAIMEFVPSSEEKLSRTFYMLGQRTKEGNILLGTTFSLMCSIAIFNLTGMVVTKLGTCLLRMIVISVRTITIWIIELGLSWNNFAALTFTGLLFTLIGVLIYNYNYLVARDSWKFDRILRMPIMFCSFLRDPSVVEQDSFTEIAPKYSKPTNEKIENTEVKAP